jgi:hypothetical protein
MIERPAYEYKKSDKIIYNIEGQDETWMCYGNVIGRE